MIYRRPVSGLQGLGRLTIFTFLSIPISNVKEKGNKIRFVSAKLAIHGRETHSAGMVMTQQDRMLQVMRFTIPASSGKIKAIISNFAECEVRRKLAEKFETFLEEGLLDPLLQYIVKDSEKDGDPKVKSLNNKDFGQT